MTFHTGAEDVFSLQHFKYRFCKIALFREVMILKCKNFFENIALSGMYKRCFFPLNLAAGAESIRELSTVSIFHFAFVNCHMPVSLKKFVSGSPPPFSSTFSLLLCSCFPY